MRAHSIGVLVCAALLARPARAEIESDEVKQAVAAWEELDFPRAVALLEKALAQTLTREEKIAAFRTLAFCQVGLDDPAAARRAFENLLRVDASHSLDRTISPRIRSVFEEAKAGMATGLAGPGEVALPSLRTETSPLRPTGGTPLVVEAPQPGGGAVQLQLFHRWRGAEVFSRVAAGMGTNGRFHIVVPGMHVTPPAVEYFAVALDSTARRWRPRARRDSRSRSRWRSREERSMPAAGSSAPLAAPWSPRRSSASRSRSPARSPRTPRRR
ncbi:MAG: hypothetical protein EXR72_22035 [Myxococcales bacterium]|nr:hypothetical protein [Myxococcales bacterium]